MRHVLIGFLLIFFTAAQSWAADTPSLEETEQQIKKLQEELQKLNTWLKETQSEKSSVEQQLEDKERSINDLLKQIDSLQKSLQQSDAQLKELSQQQRQLQQSMRQQNEQIAAQLQAIYRSGKQESIKLLLDGHTVEETTRLVFYNRYISQARQSLINGYQLQANELDIVERTIRKHRAKQAREEAILAQEKQSLAQDQQARRTILAKLNADLKQGDNRAKALKRDQQQLAELLQKLEEALVQIPIFDENTSFAELKGQLVQPLRRIRDSKKMDLGGLVLSAESGDSVNAIYHGRVVFSDWLRGFGLVLILDHGDGYMSLYGYNQSLLKEVGEWATTNEPVAKVGNTGGQTLPGLFFSIRHNGTPINPLQWIAQG